MAGNHGTHPCGRRKYRTIGLLALVAGLFYLFQCIGVSQLGKISGMRRHGHRVIMDGRAGDLKNRHTKDHDIDNSFKKIHDLNKELIDKDFHEDNAIDNVINRGGSKHKDNVNIGVISDGKTDGARDGDNDEKHPKNRHNGVFRDSKKEGQKSEMDEDKQANVNEDIKESQGEQGVGQRVELPPIMGVLQQQRKFYQPNKNGKFSCFDGKRSPSEAAGLDHVEIPMTQVNDDFCDCPNASDEPGTSACQGSRFYCTTQVPGPSPQWVYSSVVNDGICDCCDGSDEWQGGLMPDFMRNDPSGIVNENGVPHHVGSVYHAPCQDKCGDIRALRDKEEEVKRRGRKLQEGYRREARAQLGEGDIKNYGTGGILYPLSKQCFTHKDRQYSYTLCPFKSSMQNTMNLGGSKSEVTMEEGTEVIVMTGGQGHLCPSGSARMSKIYLLCGMVDQLISVSEAEKCVYVFKMSTPAAC